MPRRDVSERFSERIKIESGKRPADFGMLGQLCSEIEARSNKPLQETFMKFGLNPENPAHKDRLLVHLAEVLSGQLPRSKLKWTDEAFKKFLSDIGLDLPRVL